MDQINFNNNRVQVVGEFKVITNMTDNDIKFFFPDLGLCNIPHSGYPCCVVHMDKNQEIPAGDAWTNLVWEVNDVDNRGMHSVTVNPERINIPQSGDYELDLKVEMEATERLLGMVRFLKNGVEEIPRSSVTEFGSIAGSVMDMVSNQPYIHLDARDYIVAQVRHDGDTVKQVSSDQSYFSCRRIY